ncbi:3-methyladenine DNA glycosylase [Linnemannia schmuckeri]|uniref:3-methyladenine DNA glycosylase n=1 Tax=Linnemannia schmuckeri TaxID=64567 RepID=A0A9P5S465_9FUNG|nr:3-methyladenine DNA glycosylase [Linnemannia schmuckeri]
MQTRRKTLSLAGSTATTLKPALTSVFKHTKSRASTRTLVTKTAVVETIQNKVVKAKTSTVVEKYDTCENTQATTVKTRSRKSAGSISPEIEMTVSSMAIASLDAPEVKVTKAKEAKLKVPEENPWSKRPLHVPTYAQEALEHLCKVDPALAPLIAKYPYSVYADHDTNYFRVLSRTIVGQQVHWKAARSIIFRFIFHYIPDVTLDSLDSGDKRFPTPEQVLATPMDQLRSCGLSERKASYIQDLARHFVEGKITFASDKAALQALTDDELAAQLLCVRGIGPWTVDMFMMDTLERLDILPTLDLGIRRGMEKHFRKDYKNGVWGTIVEGLEDGKVKKGGAKGKGSAKKGEMSCGDMERMAEIWRPYRSIASWYMWRNADESGTVTAPF